MRNRPARIRGWIPVNLGPGPDKAPRLGGLVELSRTGGRFYLSWPVRPGDRIPLVLRAPGKSEPYRMACKVVWTRKDAAGTAGMLEHRMALLKELIRKKAAPRGLFYGWLAGARFEPDVSAEGIRVAQRYLEAERDARTPPPIFH